MTNTITISKADYKQLVEGFLEQPNTYRCDVCGAWLHEDEEEAAFGVEGNENTCWAQIFEDDDHAHLCKLKERGQKLEK